MPERSGIGEHIRAARLNAGLSLRRLARISGVGVATIERTESGKTSPRRATVQALAAALNTTPGALSLGLGEEE